MDTRIFKAVLDADRAPVVLCDTEHIIVYMNDAAARRYERAGGRDLIGKNVKDCHGGYGSEMIDKVVNWFKESSDNNMVFTTTGSHEHKDVYMVALRDDDKNLIGYYEKHEYRDDETAQRYDLTKSL